MPFFRRDIKRGGVGAGVGVGSWDRGDGGREERLLDLSLGLFYEFQ